MPRTEALTAEIVQIHHLVYNKIPYLLVLRADHHYEVVRDFSETILIDTTVNVERFLPSFND